MNTALAADKAPTKLAYRSDITAFLDWLIGYCPEDGVYEDVMETLTSGSPESSFFAELVADYNGDHVAALEEAMRRRATLTDDGDEFATTADLVEFLFERDASISPVEYTSAVITEEGVESYAYFTHADTCHALTQISAPRFSIPRRVGAGSYHVPAPTVPSFRDDLVAGMKGLVFWLEIARGVDFAAEIAESLDPSSPTAFDYVLTPSFTAADIDAVTEIIRRYRDISEKTGDPKKGFEAVSGDLVSFAAPVITTPGVVSTRFVTDPAAR